MRDSEPVAIPVPSSAISPRVIAVVAIAALVCSVTAQTQTAKLVADDASTEYNLGEAVSIDGDTALIGAPGDAAAVLGGAAYVFERDAQGNWMQQDRLSTGDGSVLFGTAVSVDGDTAIVGASSSIQYFGSAYVFTRDQSGAWSLQAKLNGSDEEAFDGFARSVSVDGDTAIVGAPDADNFGVHSGSAYVYVRDVNGNWTEQAKLTSPDWQSTRYFGGSVAVLGDTVLVGAPQADAPYHETGAVYVFVRDGSGNWTHQATLAANDAQSSDRMGTSVSLYDDTALVGAPMDDGAGVQAGSAYVFVRDGGGNWTQQAEFTSEDATGLDQFGISVALSGDTAVVGAFVDDDGATGAGSAYVFRRNVVGVWSQKAKLTAGDPQYFGQLGWSVALSGDTAIAGAFGDDDHGNDSGAAYVFDICVDKFTAADGASLDYLGFSSSLNGDTAIVGAYRNDSAGTDAGSAYIFRRGGEGGWVQQAKLIASDAEAGDFFGRSVSVSGDTAIVGSAFDDDHGLFSGSAYVFIRDAGGNWTEQAKLTAADAEAGDRLGFSVSVSGELALVGSHLDDGGTGSAYVFTRDSLGNWTQQAKLTAADAETGDTFGISVSLSGDTALIGATGDDDAGSRSGSAYLFTRDHFGTWAQRAKLTAADAAMEDRFGMSVSLSGDTALVGAYLSDSGGFTSSGAAYAFFRNALGVWTQQAKLTAGDPGSGDVFGKSVSLSGDTALIGAETDDDHGNGSGSAYLFSRQSDNSWTFDRKLIASDAGLHDNFGSSVAVSSDVALVGAWKDDDAAGDAGAVYSFCLARSPAATFATFGYGCAGTVGVPTLQAAQGDRPWIGEAFILELGGMPTDPTNTPFVTLGFSRTQWGSLPLPLDTSQFGIWNCTLWVSSEASVSLVNNLGTATWSLPLPANPDLIGLHLYFQGGCLDFGVNPSNVILTNAGEAVLGIR